MNPQRAEGHHPVALVTGAAVRVGRATALALARSGCDLRVTYRSRRDEAAALVREIESLGVAARADALDLDDPDAVDAYARAGARDWPRLDILVHNASSYAPSPPDGPTAPDALGHYRVNALSPLLLSTALAPLLRASALPGGGAIVAMCDIHALGRPRPGFVAYEMSKAALGAMVSALARELAPRVRVNAVAPGVVAFPDSGADSDPAMQARYLSRVPLARAGTPEDAAEAVRWLALDARYTTGQIIRVDGGRWVT